MKKTGEHRPWLWGYVLARRSAIRGRCLICEQRTARRSHVHCQRPLCRAIFEYNFRRGIALQPFVSDRAAGTWATLRFLEMLLRRDSVMAFEFGKRYAHRRAGEYPSRRVVERLARSRGRAEVFAEASVQ